MILFFSGTGNSKYVADIIKDRTGDETYSINLGLKQGGSPVFSSSLPYVFVMPTYGWRIPKVAETFVRNATFKGNKKAYFVLTCGDSTYGAVDYIKALCKDIGLDYYGFAEIAMPDNYIAMFEGTTPNKAREVIGKANPEITKIAEIIKSKKPMPDFKGRLKFFSSVINPVFYKFFVTAKGFRYTDKCITCGDCVELCPLNNIKLENQRPHWGDNCTHCMACICGCPSEAIEYKNKTKDKYRYFLTDDPDNLR